MGHPGCVPDTLGEDRLPRKKACATTGEEEKGPAGVCATETWGLADVRKEPWLECSARRWEGDKQEDKNRKKRTDHFSLFVSTMRSCSCQTVYKNDPSSASRAYGGAQEKSNISGKVKP